MLKLRVEKVLTRRCCAEASNGAVKCRQKDGGDLRRPR
ncbi:TPA: hypothetical protein SIA39_003626 [Aeromonas sobria]|nr:hypothetical protein [Aeromonas sobria]HEH9441568.1 hypothetical protein [Aeromonas sobria]